MPVIDRSTEIDAPPGDVWAVLEDVRRLPELSSGTVEVTGAPERLERPGQSFCQVVRAASRCFESRWLVVHIDPGRCVTTEGSVGFGVRYRLTQVLEPLDGGRRTRLTTHIDYRLPFGPLGRLASRLGVERMASSGAEEVLAGVKAAAEGRVRAG